MWNIVFSEVKLVLSEGGSAEHNTERFFDTAKSVSTKTIQNDSGKETPIGTKETPNKLKDSMPENCKFCVRSNLWGVT